MSDADRPQSLGSLLSGRWQIPVALAAAVSVGVALYHVAPGQPPVSAAALLADVAALEAAGATAEAADALANLLEMAPPLPDPQRAALHDRLADLIYREELRRGKPNLKNARRLLDQHDAAIQLGCPATHERWLRSARAAAWLGDFMRSSASYRAALEQGVAGPDRWSALQGLARLPDERPDGASERQRSLEALVADEGTSVGYLWWGLQQCLQDAFDAGDTVQARLLLSRYGPRLKSSDLKGYWEYLWAWVMLREGRADEAEPLVRWIDDWLEVRPDEDPELDSAGRLPALNRWLMGQIHLVQHRPDEALPSFEEALALQGRADLFVAATTGQAVALAELGRHAEAQRVLRAAAKKLAANPDDVPRGARRLRRAALELFEDFEQRGEPDTAAEYLALAVDITPPDEPTDRLEFLNRLGQTCREAAEQAADREVQRQHHGQAARCLAQAAELARTDDARYAALLWSAAEEYDRAGEVGQAQHTLQSFLAGRSSDARLPRAMLQLGQLLETQGRFEEALEWYERLRRQFPLLEQAYRAAVRKANCLQAVGRTEQAETTLSELLADDNIAPQAAAFRDALLALSELLHQQGRYGEAIGRLEEFADLYGDTPDQTPVRFLLADAYRRSAARLRTTNGPTAAAALHESRSRLRRAAELYGDLQQQLVAASAGEDELATYERLALFYRADCLFELSEPESLQQALEAYQQAARRYEFQPAGLTAQIQLANVYLQMGRPDEAARMMERARWLLRGMPDSAFADTSGADRAHWERYFAAISASDLFRGAPTGRR